MTAQRAVHVTTAAAPWSFAAPWGASGYVSSLGGPVHWIEFSATQVIGENREQTPPIVFVHGLGGSHLNWVPIGPSLAVGRRCYALDLPGFGMSPGLPPDASVQANAALLDRFITDVVGQPVILVGNSMGGLISILETHANPGNVAGLVLIDPALPAPAQRPDPAVARQFLLYALPGVGEFSMRSMQARLTSRQLVDRVVTLCFADPSRANPEVIDAGIALAEARRAVPNAERSFLRAARSLMRIMTRPQRYRDAMHAITVPTLLIHGEADRLVSMAAARDAAARNPTWTQAFLPGVGHTPQLETPDLVLDALTEWLVRHPALSETVRSKP